LGVGILLFAKGRDDWLSSCLVCLWVCERVLSF